MQDGQAISLSPLEQELIQLQPPKLGPSLDGCLQCSGTTGYDVVVTMSTVVSQKQQS